MESREEQMLTKIANGQSIDDECICRREVFLKAIANNEGTSNLPEPICREEELYTDIAANGTGGSVETEDITVTPQTTQQVINRTAGKYINKVTVNAVTNSIDSNIQAGNIKKDVSILGVTGEYEGGSEYPNADMKWAKSVCENDVQDGFPAKVLQMIDDVSATTDIIVPANGAVKTSDGGYYTNDSSSTTTITHTWNDTNSRVAECYDGFKLRWLIYYLNSTSAYCPALLWDTIYMCIDGLDNIYRTSTSTTIFQAYRGIEYFDVLQPEVIRMPREAFGSCYTLRTIPQIDTSNVVNMYAMFDRCSGLQTIPQIDTSNVVNMYQMFYGCSALKEIPQLNTSNVTDMRRMFYGCSALKEIPQLDMSKISDANGLFHSCRLIRTIPSINTGNIIAFTEMFYNCSTLREIPQIDTDNGTSMQSMFYSCASLVTIPLLNLVKCTSASSIFSNCTNLTNLTLKNIKISLQIGSGTSYGHLLTLDSLTNTIKELWDMSSSTRQTLTVGSANLTKLADVYVKLVTITDDMRAEDEYIDNKKPFEVCESTDEGAMTISDYAYIKGWEIK